MASHAVLQNDLQSTPSWLIDKCKTGIQGLHMSMYAGCNACEVTLVHVVNQYCKASKVDIVAGEEA